MRVKDKVIIVTGASSGIGESIARTLSKEGATVIAAARRLNLLEELKKESESYSGTIVPYKIDMNSKEEIDQMVDFAVKEYGRIDVLVNNAGKSDDFSFAGEASDEMWDSVISLNLNSVFYATRAALKYMKEAKSGNIINMASVGGIGYSRAGVSYTVTKHAVVALTKNTAFAYANEGIRCNVICPGTIDTPMVQALSDTSHLYQAGFERCLSGSANAPRVGSSDEIANIALFLASDESSLMNGALLAADAGWTAY